MKEILVKIEEDLADEESGGSDEDEEVNSGAGFDMTIVTIFS